MTNVRSRNRGLLPYATALVAFAALFGCSHGGQVQASGDGSSAVLDLESFLTNVSDPFTERYCKVTVKLVLSPPETVERINDSPLLLARIRDKILTLVTSKTALELSDSQGKETFRDEIGKAVSELLGTGKVDQVLFAEFVVQ